MVVVVEKQVLLYILCFSDCCINFSISTALASAPVLIQKQQVLCVTVNPAHLGSCDGLGVFPAQV